MKISGIDLKVIKDSRQEDTLEVTLRSDSFESTASVPSGKSKGKFEVASISPVQALEKIEGSKGGGHENAVGGQISINDIEKFRENLTKIINLS